MRFGLELTDVTDLVAEVPSSSCSATAAAKGLGVVKAINGKQMATLSRKDLDDLTSFCGRFRGQGPGLGQDQARAASGSLPSPNFSRPSCNRP